MPLLQIGRSSRQNPREITCFNALLQRVGLIRVMRALLGSACVEINSTPMVLGLEFNEYFLFPPLLEGETGSSELQECTR